MTPDENALGQILRELGQIRTDIGSMREHSDQRHRTLANEMHEVREAVRRAEATANDAKRIAELSASDTLTMQRAVMDHTKGLVARVTAVEESNTEQNTKLDVLVKAAEEQRIREDERKKLEEAKMQADDKRWQTVERWKSLATWAWPILAAAAGYALAHLRVH